MKSALVILDPTCQACGATLGYKNGESWCSNCKEAFCEVCAVQEEYCPECWDDKEDGKRK